MVEFITEWSALSSNGLIGSLFDLLKESGDWAGALASILGLL